MSVFACALAALACGDDGTAETIDWVQNPTGGTGGTTGFTGGTTGAGVPGAAAVPGGANTGGIAGAPGGNLTGGGGVTATGGGTSGITGGSTPGGVGSTTGGTGGGTMGATGGGTMGATGGGTMGATGGGTMGGGTVGGSPMGTCSQTPVSGLSLSNIDVFQSVQIRVMKAGQPISRGMRNADVVVGRKTVFRIHVTPDAGWTARDVEARVELTDAMGQKAFFAKMRPTAASTDANLMSTFQVSVPAEAVTADAKYAVTLLECGAAMGAGAATGARFPSDGFAELGARQTGPLKVHIVPIAGTDVTEAGLKPFKDRLEAVYPITQVMFTIGQPATGSGASSMCSLLSAVQARRSADRPAADIYYFGLSPGILGGQSGCSNTSGSKVSAGWAGGYNNDPRVGAGTMCHELGHAHGRMHAPCNVQDPDPRFPYPNANIGVMGYDNRTNEFYQSNRKDMMSYCPEPRYNAWISDYTYQAILVRAAQVNGQMAELPFFAALAEPDVAWRMLVSDSAGVHWTDEPLLVQGTPEGESMRAIVHGDQGAIQEVEVYKQDLEDGSEGAYLLVIPQPDASWRAIEVPGLLAPQTF